MRSKEDWQREIAEDLGWIRYHTDNALRTLEHSHAKRDFAAAIKEARRAQSDLYRLAELCGISKDEIDSEHV